VEIAIAVLGAVAAAAVGALVYLVIAQARIISQQARWLAARNLTEAIASERVDGRPSVQSYRRNDEIEAMLEQAMRPPVEED